MSTSSCKREQTCEGGKRKKHGILWGRSLIISGNPWPHPGYCQEGTCSLPGTFHFLIWFYSRIWKTFTGQEMEASGEVSASEKPGWRKRWSEAGSIPSRQSGSRQGGSQESMCFQSSMNRGHSTGCLEGNRTIRWAGCGAEFLSKSLTLFALFPCVLA